MLKASALALAVLGVSGITAGALAGAASPAAADEFPLDQVAFDNPTGAARTVNLNGRIDLDNPFFQDLGTNGRRCVTCHQPDSAWSITPDNVQARFSRSKGTDPIFRNNDGSNCEGVRPRNFGDQRHAYSLLLGRGLIRVGLDVPANAEFAIDGVRDPLRCGPASNDVSVYRRPLPTTNLRFVSAVMWDGRESGATTTIVQDLHHQANSATRGHAGAATDITADQAQAIVEFEMGLFTAQARDDEAGSLHAGRAAGGPKALSGEAFFIGINDPVGLNPTGAAFDPSAFTLYNAWEALARSKDRTIERRRSIARGQQIFNTKPIVISGVSGLNGQTFPNGVTVPETITGSCTVCHDTPNAGNHSVKAPLDIGLADPSIARYLPVYTLRRLATNETVKTTDPGRAMITGKWSDVGRFKGPILRALAARAPYFHNGAAATLAEAVEFYETRFKIGLTPQEKRDLIAFLLAL